MPEFVFSTRVDLLGNRVVANSRCRFSEAREVAKEGPFQLQYRLQSLMQDKVGIARTEDGLSEAVDGIHQIGTELAAVGAGGNRWFNPGWHTALDMKHLLTVAEAITRSARERRESRGAHSRLDHLEKDPAWGTFNHVIRKAEDGTMHVERRDIPEIRPELKTIIEEQG